MTVQDIAGRSPLHDAVANNDLARARNLIARGADVNLADKAGWTPLHVAARAQAAEIAALLLSHGAEVDPVDSDGNTPLMTAVVSCKGHGDLIHLLRRHGADPYRTNTNGVSPVTVARSITTNDVARHVADLPADDPSDIGTHPNPVWRERADFIIAARLDDSWLPLTWEQLWTRRLGENAFELCCIPFYAYDLALGDRVACAAREGQSYVVSHLVAPSLGSTFRVWFGETNDPAARAAVPRSVVDAGGAVEWRSPNFLAIHAPDPAVAQRIADHLWDLAQRGGLIYETGRRSRQLPLL